MTNYIARKELNGEKNGVEIYFNVFPITATRENLKKNGFKWNHKKSCWYAKQNTTTLSLASICAETTKEEYKHYADNAGETIKEIKKETRKAEKPAENKPAENKFGVKVGDFFSMSWGYEQTNNDFFQVIELVGSCSVRIREVNPEIIKRESVSGMSEDRVYNLDTTKILPPAPCSTFIKDQEHGDLKRLKSYAKDGISNPQINMTSYADAHLCNSGEKKVYESWYY